MRILVLHGPNLNLLGEREPEVYGSMTLDELNGRITVEATRLGCELTIFQSNHEGELIDKLHAYRNQVDGVIFNPGAYTHYSYALRDAVAAIPPPVVEVHLSDISKREEFRRVSVIAPECEAQISGKGWKSYVEALEFLKSSRKASMRARRNSGG